MLILVMSCDKNGDLFEPFHHCMEKYGASHPQVVYSTESIVNPFYKTICKNYGVDQGTRRVRETVQELEDEFILLMCDDIFLRDYVKDEEVSKLESYFDANTASLNLHRGGSGNIPVDDFVSERGPKALYKTSVMCSLWRRDKLLKVFDGDANPGQFETSNKHKGYRYLILSKKLVLDGGHYQVGDLFGIYRGKGDRKTAAFLSSEGLNIDFKRRGFCEV